MSGRPLKIQFRDLGAEYNQLAQMQSAQNQNQLAQMQMQEARQLAPYRMQEQQSRAATAKMTFDEVNEAKNIVNGIMAKAAEFPDAPRDPFQAAKEMFNSSNSIVRDGGEKLLKSLQILQAYEYQRANEKAYEEDRLAGAPAPAGLPAVVAPSANNVAAPMVAPGMPAPVGIDQGRGVVAFPVKPVAIEAEGTIDIAPDVKINAKFKSQIVDKLKNYGETASLKEFPGMRWTLSPSGLLTREPIPAELAPVQGESVNALAPAVAAAPAVNAMAKKAVNPLQDPAALMKKIQDGNQRFARGGVATPGWAQERELLIKAFEQAVKVERNQGQRYISLGAGAALDTESGLIIAKDKIPAASAAPRIISIKGVPHTVNAEGNLEPLTVEGGALPAAAVTAAPKIINIKGIPHTLNEDGNLVPVPVEGGVLPAVAAKSQAVAAPKIINIKGIPHTLNAEGKLVRVPIEGGALPVAGKVGTNKQAAAGKPKPPSGYRYDATGENLEPIPGGPADKQEKLKPIPAHINTAISTNDMSIKRIQEALDLIKKNPDAVGLKNLLPGQALDRMDPKGVAARSAISDIGSLVIHDRSGSAVSVGEMQRLGFIPTPTDRADNAKTKLESMLKWAKLNQQGLSETYGEDQGYKASPTLSGKSKAAPATVSNW